MKTFNPDYAVVLGSAVKALGNGKVGGYLVLFTTEKDPDLTGDFFTKDTDLGMGDSAKSAVYYNHGQDPELGTRVLGEGILSVKDAGVWIEAQLNMRDEYEKAVYDLAKKGKLGWSSGTAPHLIEREASGKSTHIKKWPLGLDASLTPTPCEARTAAIPLKSFVKSGWMSNDKAELLRRELAEKFGEYVYLDNFDDDTVYWCSFLESPAEYYAASYSIGDDGEAMIKDPYEVNRKTIYVREGEKSLGISLSDHAKAALGSLEQFVNRAEGYASLKRDSGRALSVSARESFEALKSRLDAVLAATDTQSQSTVDRSRLLAMTECLALELELL